MDDGMMAMVADEVRQDGVQTEINMRWKKIKKEGEIKDKSLPGGVGGSQWNSLAKRKIFSLLIKL